MTSKHSSYRQHLLYDHALGFLQPAPKAADPKPRPAENAPAEQPAATVSAPAKPSRK